MDPVLDRKFNSYYILEGINKTSRLLAIMLGRFRMTVSDCMIEYRYLAHQMFSKPRILSTLRFGVGNRYKYDADRLEKAFKEVTNRRSEQLQQGEEFRKITFPSGKGLCKT